ncbi:MAG: glycosyltransferase family 39 protein [Chloroflexi bacterium]|nr:glycosyltransferase family 39 protein [Chloroflexota bacterium]
MTTLRTALRRDPSPLLFLLALLIYLGLTLYQIDLPGPNYDEAVEAKPAVQLIQGLPVEAHRQAVIKVGGKDLPLMIVDYVGALNSYMLWLYFKIGGISVAMMRLWPITVGAAILWLSYRFTREVIGPHAAVITAFLLATQPSFIFFTRQGIYVTNTTIALTLVILLALWRLLRTGHLRWWFLTAFAAGLGLWAKFIMLWPLLALLVLLPFLWLLRKPLQLRSSPRLSVRKLLSPGALAGALAAFLLGLSPFILFNIKTGATFAFFTKTLGQTYYGVENTDYWHNLAERWRQLADFLRGDHFWYLGGNFRDALAQPAWFLGFALILVALIWRRHDPEFRKRSLRALFFYAFIFLLLLQTPLTPTALWYTHLALFSPFLAMATAAGLDVLVQGLPERRWRLVVTAGFVLLLGGSALQADIHYHQALTASGGYADHSDASYRLAATLQANGITQPYALDWGFDAPLILISKGQVNPIEIFGYEPYDHPDAAFPDRVRPLLHQPGTVFLLHAPDRTNFPGRREALEAVAAAEHIPLQTLAVIRERSGAPHTEIWVVGAP